MKLPELLKFRADVTAAIRQFFHSRGYTEVDTPIALLAPPPEVHIDPVATSIESPRGMSNAIFKLLPSYQ